AKMLLKKYKRVCAVSPLEVPFIQKFGVPKEKIVLVPNGIPADFFSEEEKRYFRVKWNLKENDMIVLSLSRLHKSKGFDVIVRVAGKFPQVKFVIAGKDEGFKAELQQLIENLQVKNVFLVGEIPEADKKKAFAAADIFVHPSHFEAFGIVVLEAMAQGKPVITSDVGGLPWVVKDAGLLFQDNNVNELEDRLKRLLYSGSLRKELSKNAVKRAKGLTWEKITDHLEKMYKELV
ncbi:MAG: glycosyltransferase family 4 protein, partial [Candidatus Nanoarchaeia archaeon]